MTRPKPQSHLFRTALAVFILVFFAAIARAETYGDITIAITSPVAAQTSHGYAEYRVTITNASPLHTHTVGIEIPHDSYASGEYIRSP